MNSLADYFLNDPVGRKEFWKMYSDSQRKILEEATDGDDFLPFIEASIKEGRYFSDYDIYMSLCFGYLKMPTALIMTCSQGRLAGCSAPTARHTGLPWITYWNKANGW